jgi:hypothetical protein
MSLKDNNNFCQDYAQEEKEQNDVEEYEQTKILSIYDEFKSIPLVDDELNIFQDVELVTNTISDDIKNINWIIETYKDTENIILLSNKKILTYQIYITDFLKQNFDYSTDESKDFFNNCIIWLYNATLFQLLQNNQIILKKSYLLPAFMNHNEYKGFSNKSRLARSSYKLCMQNQKNLLSYDYIFKSKM